MVIGLKYGKCVKGDDAAVERTRALVRRFVEEFITKNGAVNSTNRLGFDLSDPNAYVVAQESGIFIERCPLIVRDAADILERS